MGQPESKPQQQNGFRSGISSSSSSPVSSPSSSFSKKRDDTVPKSTKKKKQNTQEAIPYTSYSIPKQESGEERGDAVAAEDNFNSNATPHNAQSTRDLQNNLPNLPVMSSFSRRPIDIMDPKSVLAICIVYKEVLQNSSGAAAKHQKELAAKLKLVENITANALKTLKREATEITTFEANIKNVASVGQSIERANQLLREVLQKTQKLCDLLPSDFKMDDGIPIPSFLDVSEKAVQRAAASDKDELLLKQGIPNSARGTIWKKLVGNRLQITKENYDTFREKVKQKKEDTENPDKTFLGDCRLITLDIPRTFPSIDEICKKPTSTFYDDLTKILEAYMVFRPAVSYVQGMSYVAGMLLFHMDEFDTFVCMANILENHLFESLYKMNIPEIKKHLNIFDLLFADHIPSLYEHFKNLKIEPEHYLLTWLSTIFSKEVLPLKLSVRIWDGFLQDGEVYLYRATLGILRLLKDKLLQSQFEECINALKHLPQELDEKSLFDSIESITTAPYIHNFITRIAAEGKW